MRRTPECWENGFCPPPTKNQTAIRPGKIMAFATPFNANVGGAQKDPHVLEGYCNLRRASRPCQRACRPGPVPTSPLRATTSPPEVSPA